MMRKQKLMRMAAAAAAGMLLMTGCADNGSQATAAASEMTQAPETAVSETTEAETTDLEENGETDVPSLNGEQGGCWYEDNGE